MNVTQPYHSCCSCNSRCGTCCPLSFCLHEGSKMWLHSNPPRPATTNAKNPVLSCTWVTTTSAHRLLPGWVCRRYSFSKTLSPSLCLLPSRWITFGWSWRWNFEHVLKDTVFHDGSPVLFIVIYIYIWGAWQTVNPKRLTISTFVRRRWNNISLSV